MPDTCPEGVTQCDIDCPRYGRDCDGDEIIFPAGYGGRTDCEDSDDR